MHFDRVHFDRFYCMSFRSFTHYLRVPSNVFAAAEVVEMGREVVEMGREVMEVGREVMG